VLTLAGQAGEVNVELHIKIALCYGLVHHDVVFHAQGAPEHELCDEEEQHDGAGYEGD